MLSLLRAVTTRLPTIRGSGRLVRVLMRLYLRRQRPVVEANVDGHLMELRPGQYVEQWLLFAPQFYERRELRSLTRHLRPGDTFVDIGAHVGRYSLVAARAVGSSGRVIAVEADPETSAILARNVARNASAHVEVVRVGVSDRNERLILGVRAEGNLAGNSFLYPASTGVEVECQPLRNILGQRNVVRVDAAKLDIEGFEYRVLSAFLASAPRSLWPRWLLVEFHPSMRERAGGDTLELLRTRGYVERERYDTNHIFVLPT